MNRRNFLQVLGAFTASAILPIQADALIAESQKFGEATTFLLFRCRPLAPGHYTLSWISENGLAVFGIDTLGGEKYVKVWCDTAGNTIIMSPKLGKEVLCVELPSFADRLSINFSEPDGGIGASITRGADILQIGAANWWSRS